MAWVRIDDQFPDHPKVAAAGPLAGWLHVCGLCYCNRHLTDGFIPKSVAHRLTDYEHVGLATAGVPGVFAVGDDVDCAWMARVLCDAGLWKEVQGGYEIHDYLDYQPSRDEVEEMRRQKQAAGQAGGQASAKARAQASALAKGKQTSKQNPTPNPSPYPTQHQEPKSKKNHLAVDVTPDVAAIVPELRSIA